MLKKKMAREHLGSFAVTLAGVMESNKIIWMPGSGRREERRKSGLLVEKDRRRVLQKGGREGKRKESRREGG